MGGTGPDDGLGTTPACPTGIRYTSIGTDHKDGIPGTEQLLDLVSCLYSDGQSVVISFGMHVRYVRADARNGVRDRVSD